jgi:hypothetical protein
MALKASTRLIASRQRSLFCWSLGALTVGLGVNWRSAVHGSTRYIPVTFRSLHSVHQGLFSAITSTSTGMMASLTPPQPAPTWTHTADDVMRLTKEAIKKDREVQDKVAALAPKDCNMSSVSDLRSVVSED